MATSTRKRRTPALKAEPTSDTHEVHPALKELGGWDETGRRWVHRDPGKTALDLVNEAAAKRRAATDR